MSEDQEYPTSVKKRRMPINLPPKKKEEEKLKLTTEERIREELNLFSVGYEILKNGHNLSKDEQEEYKNALGILQARFGMHIRIREDEYLEIAKKIFNDTSKKELLENIPEEALEKSGLGQFREN